MIKLYVIVFSQWGTIESELVFAETPNDARMRFNERHSQAKDDIEILQTLEVFQ